MNMQSGQLVNKIGKYLYKRIDGSYKIQFSVNTCDVYMFMYYQAKGEEMHQMNFNISITTYQSKIRVNITEITVLEKTIGQIIYQPKTIGEMNENDFLSKVYRDVIGKIAKEYSEYEFAF